MVINVPVLASVVASRMVNVVDANRKTFIHTDDFESVFENCFDMEVGDKLKGDYYTRVYQDVEKEAEILLAYATIAAIIADERQAMIADAKEENFRKKNPKAYYGV